MGKIKITATISFIVLLQLSGCGGENSESDEKSEAQRKFELGVSYLEDGEGLKAFLVFDELMEEDPKNPHYIYGKALAIVEKELASAAEKTKQILDFINEVGSTLASPPQNTKFQRYRVNPKTQDERKVERKIIDSILLKILKIAFLDTTDKLSALLRETDFFSLAGDNFVFPIRRFRIKFYFGGEEINSFSFYGKHGIEEAYLIAGLAELIRFILYSILSVSFDLEIPEIFSILNYAGKKGGILTLLSDPIEVGFPSLYWVLERNRKILTAPYKEEMRKAKLALDKQIEYFENYHLKIYNTFSKGDTRNSFLIFSKGDGRAYIRAQVGDGEIKEFSTGTLKGIQISGQGMKLVRKSIEEGYLVPCSHIEGPVTSLLSAVSNSGFSSVLAESASAGAGEEGKEIGERFNKAVQLILYFAGWFSAFVSLCSQDLFYFDFSKYFDALSSLRNIIPAYFSATTKDVISPLRNMIIEWECGREKGINTLTYSSEFFDPSSVGLMCRRKVKLYDTEHFQDFLTMVRFPGNLSPQVSVIPKDGIRSPTGYLLIPDPSVAGFLWIDPKVLWPDCEIPCRGECKIQKLEREVGQCIMNAGFAEIGRRIYVGRGF